MSGREAHLTYNIQQPQRKDQIQQCVPSQKDVIDDGTWYAFSKMDFLFDCQTANVPEDLFIYDDDKDAASEMASLSWTVRTELDNSSVHTPDSTCAFCLSTPAA